MKFICFYIWSVYYGQCNFPIKVQAQTVEEAVRLADRAKLKQPKAFTCFQEEPNYIDRGACACVPAK